MLTLNADSILNFDKAEVENLNNLIGSYNAHITKNIEKNRYYEGKSLYPKNYNRYPRQKSKPP